MKNKILAHKSKQKQRGYNQVDKFGRALEYISTFNETRHENM